MNVLTPKSDTINFEEKLFFYQQEADRIRELIKEYKNLI
jgi:hypothetical protein